VEVAEQGMLVSAIPALERVVLSAGAGMIVTTALPKGTVESVDLGKSVVIVAPGRLVDPGKTAAVGRTVVFVEQEMAVPIAALKGIAAAVDPEMVAASGEAVKAADSKMAVPIAAQKGIVKAADQGKAVVIVAVGEVAMAADQGKAVVVVVGEVAMAADWGKAAVVVAVGRTVVFVGRGIVVPAVPAKIPGRVSGD